MAEAAPSSRHAAECYHVHRLVDGRPLQPCRIYIQYDHVLVTTDSDAMVSGLQPAGGGR